MGELATGLAGCTVGPAAEVGPRVPDGRAGLPVLAPRRHRPQVGPQPQGAHLPALAPAPASHLRQVPQVLPLLRLRLPQLLPELLYGGPGTCTAARPARPAPPGSSLGLSRE